MSIEVGGSATVTLTVDEMPRHWHETAIYSMGNGGKWGGISEYGNGTRSGEGYHTMPVGGDQPHNNMPPYVVKYCWERIS